MKIWTVTTDGDNCPIETEVFLSEAGARAYIVDCIRSYDPKAKTAILPLGGLSDLYTDLADGACIIQEHDLGANDNGTHC
jgi:hypothetical protein